MTQGFILCYMSKDEMKAVYNRIMAIKETWFTVNCYVIEHDVPYPYTILVKPAVDKLFEKLDDLFATKVDIGTVDIYMLYGREREVQYWMPVDCGEL